MSTKSHALIQAFWIHTNARDWSAFAALLHADVSYQVPQTRERVQGRDNFVELFRTWPGNWTCHLQEVVADETLAVSRIQFELDGEIETGISFFTLRDGLITAIRDYWPAPYEPPPRVCGVVQRDSA
jgi:ketosteroid isomerase-like protein